MGHLRLWLAALVTALPGLAWAEFQPVGGRAEFLALVEGRELTLPGIRLQVTRGGEILGRAYGRDVTGAWRWQDGYFCRDLAWGARDLGANCQQVTRSGHVLRFTSDRGSGRSADLTLR